MLLLQKKRIRMATAGRLTRTLRDMFLAVSAAYAHTIDNVSLFCLVAKAASLVGARRTGSPMNDVQLSVLPATISYLQLM